MLVLRPDRSRRQNNFGLALSLGLECLVPVSRPELWSRLGLPRVLEYSFNSTFGRKFQFSVLVFKLKEQLLEFYANVAPSPSSCDLRVASFAT